MIAIVAFISFLFVAQKRSNVHPPILHVAPFSDLDIKPSVLQNWLREDILRRSKELIALGWLGRAYITAPVIFNKVFPSLFRLQSYNDTALSTKLPDGKTIVDCTLKESSILARGIPIRLLFLMNDVNIESVKLLGIGPNVKGEVKDNNDNSVTYTPLNPTLLCESININTINKKLVVKAITSGIFNNIPNIMKMVETSVDLEAIGPTENFHPRNDLFAQEGTSKKWLQEVFIYIFMYIHIFIYVYIYM
jgi:hypothetical protein